MGERIFFRIAATLVVQFFCGLGRRGFCVFFSWRGGRAIFVVRSFFCGASVDIACLCVLASEINLFQRQRGGETTRVLVENFRPEMDGLFKPHPRLLTKTCFVLFLCARGWKISVSPGVV